MRYTDDGIELEANPRHAEIVVEELGLQSAKLSRVSGTKEPKPKKDKEESENVEKVQLLDEELFEEETEQG